MLYNQSEITNRKPLFILILLLICLIFTNCNSNKNPNIKEIEENLRKADLSIQNAVAQKDINSLISFYADDACLLPTAEPIVKGKSSIKQEWQHIFQIPDFSNKSSLTKIEISKDGSMAYTMGSYLAIMQGEDGNSVQEPGKWVTIWKKQSDGQWLIIVDTYNTDVPPPDHK
jgi:ketosteroid isomerase-like protein